MMWFDNDFGLMPRNLAPWLINGGAVVVTICVLSLTISRFFRQACPRREASKSANQGLRSFRK